MHPRFVRTFVPSFAVSRFASLLLLAGLLGPNNAAAQTQQPVTWSASVTPAKAAPGQSVRITLSAKIDAGWHLYSVTSPVTATATKFSVPEGVPLEITQVYQKPVTGKFDAVAQATTESYEGETTFVVDAKVTGASAPAEMALQVRSSACNDRLCLPPRKRMVPITLTLDAAAPTAPLSAVEGHVEAKVAASPSANSPSATTPSAGTPSGNASGGSASVTDQPIGQFLLLAFSFGLAAIFTPCVFPMIPFTLSYFVNQKEGSRVVQALTFCLGIVFLFTAMGLLLSALVGASGAQSLSAHPIVNGVIAALFFAFALSLFGLFEITLPSGLLTKLNAASSGGGLIGALLMGLTFSLTSFACVGPFVGTLLAASVQGSKLQPTLGMMAFSSGLALPFFLLALSPAALNKLPRSGVWMMRIKVVMGFLILAAMLKYLSNVDEVLQLHLLTRERFLAAWIVLFALAGAYLLGRLRLEGINPEEEVGVGRLLTGTLFLTFAISLLPGMMGAPLGELDAYVPLANRTGLAASGAAAGPVWIKNDLPAALAKAKAENKHVFINFTGYACTNCHWMKSNMFPRPEIAAELNNLVLVELYTDGLDEASEKNQKLQESRFANVAIPFYVIVDANDQVLRNFPGLTKDPAEFLKFLKGA